jgi:hypothetical protein
LAGAVKHACSLANVAAFFPSRCLFLSNCSFLFSLFIISLSNVEWANPNRRFKNVKMRGYRILSQNQKCQNERIPYPLTKSRMSKRKDTVSSHKIKNVKTRGYRILSQNQKCQNERIPYSLTKSKMIKSEDTVSSHKIKNVKTRGY